MAKINSNNAGKGLFKLRLLGGKSYRIGYRSLSDEGVK